MAADARAVHAPGQIALVRERDGVALTSDAFDTLDVQTGLRCAPRLGHPAFHHDREQAAASLRERARPALSAAWPGHAEPVTGDVGAQLERAAGT